MIKSKNDLRFWLQEDAKRNDMNGNYFAYLLKLLCGLENAMVYRYLRKLRYTEYHYNNKGLIHKILYLYNNMRLHQLGAKYHIQIPLNKTGYGLRIMHLTGGGILLNVNKIGNYCGFNAGSFIGNNGSTNSRPTIGDFVAFGPGAKAFGKITIGNNVFIAPNAVVTKDVPDNHIVGGVPAKLIKEYKLEDNSVYMKYFEKK